jgi:isopentenyl diphosphate isomerase/L-lactate dehydrogenase-like FMN-dependent dehydrogenase
MSEKPLEQMGLRDLRKIMRRKAPAEAWKHFNGAAETKATFHRNPRAFHQYLFRQKIFHDVAEPDIAIELFGHTLPLPAMTAPVGSFSLISKDAERQVAEGTAGRGDIVKALALGAKAVLVGRPVAWGVGAFGARGVERVFAIFAEEMQRVLTMTGVAHVRDVSRSILFRDELGGLRGL